jgi:hypothetical protein
MAAEAAPSGSDRAKLQAIETQEKPSDSGGFFTFAGPALGRENLAGLLDIGGALC